jgi:hypothetical protein
MLAACSDVSGIIPLRPFIVPQASWANKQRI